MPPEKSQRSVLETATRDSSAAKSDIPEAQSLRVVIERIRPSIDGGRFPIKRTPGEFVEVTADIFADGHDVIAAVLRDRKGFGIWDSGFDDRPNPKS